MYFLPHTSLFFWRHNPTCFHTCHRWGTVFTNVWIRVVNKRKITIRIYWQAKEGCGGVLDPLRGKGENLRGSQEHSGLDQKARGLARFFVWYRDDEGIDPLCVTRKWERLVLLMWKWDVIRILQSKIAKLVYQYWKKLIDTGCSNWKLSKVNGCKTETVHIWLYVGKAKMRLRGSSSLAKL